MKSFREWLREEEALNEAKSVLDDVTIVYSKAVKDYGGFIPNSVMGVAPDDDLRSIGNVVKVKSDIKDVIRLFPKNDPAEVKKIASAYYKVYPKFIEYINNILDKGVDTYFTVTFSIHPSYGSIITQQNLSNVFKKYDVLGVYSERIYGGYSYECVLSSKKPTTVLEIYNNSKPAFDKFVKANNIEIGSSDSAYISTMAKAFDTTSESREILSKYIKPELRQLYSYDLATSDKIKNSNAHLKSLKK